MALFLRQACCLFVFFLPLFFTGCADKERNLPRYTLDELPPVDLSTGYSNEVWENNLKYRYQPLPKPLKDPVIVINKNKRMLYLFSGQTLMRVYPINLGPDRLRDKVKQGDGRTPEGEFYVCNKNPKSKYFKSLGLSYPTKEDALRGLKSGLITKKQYDQIVWAIDHKKKPPWFTRLGGAVCIHGGGIGWDWTRGCIALRNQDMQELYEVTPVGAKVIIISGLNDDWLKNNEIRDKRKQKQKTDKVRKEKDNGINDKGPIESECKNRKSKKRLEKKEKQIEGQEAKIKVKNNKGLNDRKRFDPSVFTIFSGSSDIK